MSAIVLPRISRVRLTGFAPLFEKTIEIEISNQPHAFLILGGNGLGKTSILQSIVFALAGIAGHDLQDAREDSRFKWDMSYFKERVKDPQNSEVTVEFYLGSTRLQVRRGLSNESVRGICINDGAWDNSKQAEKKYEDIVIRDSRCASLRDFRYLVHRLCYLPESRRNIVWDPDAQLAVFLHICAPAGVETQIREKVARWRSTYVEMRHTQTSITNIKRRLEGAEVSIAAKKGSPARREKNSEESIRSRFDSAQKAFETNVAEISAANARIVSFGRALNDLAEQVESEEWNLAALEENFVLRSLRDTERREAALALHKMTILHQCPYCTQHNDALSTQASARIATDLCPICGLSHITSGQPDNLAATKEVLRQKIELRSNLQAELTQAHRQVNSLREKNAQLEIVLSEASAQLPRIRRDEKVGLSEDPEDLRRMLSAYENEYRRLSRASSSLKADMEQAYADVEQSQARRYSSIEKRVARYATEFLGTTCTFTRVAAKNVDKDTPFAFDVLVPSFEGSARTEPQQCSESQAFFLDIAFRMAVLDTARDLSKCSPTLICETPENALDMAYADNVAQMFAKFSEAGCFSLLTANLQSGGVAEPLLKKTKASRDRARQIFNLLEVAKLSKVQQDARPKFEKQLRKLLHAS